MRVVKGKKLRSRKEDTGELLGKKVPICDRVLTRMRKSQTSLRSCSGRLENKDDFHTIGLKSDIWLWIYHHASDSWKCKCVCKWITRYQLSFTYSNSFFLLYPAFKNKTLRYRNESKHDSKHSWIKQQKQTNWKTISNYADKVNGRKSKKCANDQNLEWPATLKSDDWNKKSCFLYLRQRKQLSINLII